jgi:hypothetical protein
MSHLVPGVEAGITDMCSECAWQKEITAGLQLNPELSVNWVGNGVLGKLENLGTTLAAPRRGLVPHSILEIKS